MKSKVCDDYKPSKRLIRQSPKVSQKSDNWSLTTKRQIIDLWEAGTLIKDISEAVGLDLVPVGVFLRGKGYNTRANAGDSQTHTVDDTELRTVVMHQLSLTNKDPHSHAQFSTEAFDRRVIQTKVELARIAKQTKTHFLTAQTVFIALECMELTEATCSLIGKLNPSIEGIEEIVRAVRGVIDAIADV